MARKKRNRPHERRNTAPATAGTEGPPASPRPGVVKRVSFHLAPFLAFFALLGAIEIVARLASSRIDSLDVFVRSELQKNDLSDNRSVRIAEGDPLVFWRIKPNLSKAIWDYTLVTTNAQGLRREEPLGRKPRGGFRVVCLGDSVTFGYRVPTVWPERPDDYPRDALPYPMLIEDWLRRANSGRSIDVLALAAPGYTSHQGLALLRREIAELQPDVVTICFGWNDTDVRELPDREIMPTDEWSAWRRRAIASSQTLLRLSAWLNQRRARASSPSPGAKLATRVSQSDYVANVLAAAALAREHGATPVILGPVYRDSFEAPEQAVRMTSYRDALREAARSAGVSYLEFPELIESAAPANKWLFGELIHPNHAGHLLMARRLLSHLMEREMLAGLAAPRLPNNAQ
ncbi:MAG: SGNH/GDSL hydrolase family protein [Vicinamibacteria bacterium]|nr:SGNH/GDSL hydrolase family protein [Vicinamibacteria bacterium]